MDSIVTLCGVMFLNIWGMSNGDMTYEGCDLMLSDGKACALGKMARQSRLWNPNCEHGHSRNREGHLCRPIGEGRYMYCFFVQIGNEVVNVWEQAGEQLFGLTGQQFHEIYGTREQQKEACHKVMKSKWVVTWSRSGGENTSEAGRMMEIRRMVDLLQERKEEEEIRNKLIKSLGELKLERIEPKPEAEMNDGTETSTETSKPRLCVIQ